MEGFWTPDGVANYDTTIDVGMWLPNGIVAIESSGPPPTFNVAWASGSNVIIQPLINLSGA